VSHAIELVAIAGGIGAGVVYLLLRRRLAESLAGKLSGRGRPCPLCRARAVAACGAVLATTRGDDGRWRPAHETSYRCGACGAELRALNDGPLIAREAWDAGAREDIPRARVVE
jgi:hypothetical protein